MSLLSRPSRGGAERLPERRRWSIINMFVVTHGQRGSERFEWQSVHKVGEMWEQHKDAMEWPYWFMEGKIVRDPAGQLGQDRWWAGGTRENPVHEKLNPRAADLQHNTSNGYCRVARKRNRRY
jgi:hypothetical protein